MRGARQAVPAADGQQSLADTPAPNRQPSERQLTIAGGRSLAPSRVPAGPGARLTTEPGDRDEAAADRIAQAPPPATRGASPSTRPLPSTTIDRESAAGLPAPVAAVVSGAGSRLDPATRARHEARLGYDLGDVRIHEDATAGAANRALDSVAFALGRHVALRPGSYRAGSPEGDSLLSHELAHVAAPPRGALIGRQTATQPRPAAANPTPAAAGQGQAAPQGQGQQPAPGAQAQGQAGQAAQAPQADPTPQIRAWLDAHQIAPPTSQPETGERHVLLNGEDMPQSQAVQLCATALGLSPDVVRPVLMSYVSRTSLFPASTQPVIGPGNLVPGLDLTPGAGGHLPLMTMKAMQLDEIDQFLAQHGYAPPDIRDPTGAAAVFDGRPTTVDAVADRVMANYRDTSIGGAGGINMSYLTRTEVVDHLRQKYVEARGGPGNQIMFGYTLIPGALQAVTGPRDPLNPVRNQHQFSFTITRQHHAQDSPGLESSFQGTVTIDDSGHVMNVQAGGQEAIVLPLLQGWIQVSGLVQVMQTLNWNRTVSGTTVIAPSIQAQAGGQILLTPNPHSGPFAFLRGHVQVGVQVLGGLNIPLTDAGGSTTVGVQGGAVLNIPF